jgi:hypothetical protein
VAVLAMSGHNISETYHPAKILGDRSASFVSVLLMISAFGIGGVLVAGFSLAIALPVAFGLGIYALIAGPLCLAAINSRTRQLAQAVERTISFQDGVVTVATANESETWPISECCWFSGKATDDLGLSYQPIRTKAIVLVFPTGRALACGLSEPLYSEWLSTVRSYQCRRVLRQEGLLGLIFWLLSIAGLIGGMLIGWSVGVAIHQAVFPQGAKNLLGNLIPGALAILFAWVLALAPWLIPGWRRHTEHERSQFVRFAILLPAKLAIPAGAVLGGNLISGVVLASAFAILFVIIALAFTRRIKESGI